MRTRSRRTSRDIDAYVGKAPAWAQPILRELRQRLHAACPQATETLKWRTPAFECDGLLAGMAAFQRYCTFAFWKEKLLLADAELAPTIQAVGRMTKVSELPSRAAFARVVKRAMQLNRDGVVVPRTPAAKKPKIPMPVGFANALAADSSAGRHFAAFSPSQQREYLEWIATAKQDSTRQRRIEQAIAWIAAGKRRNWKYERG